MGSEQGCGCWNAGRHGFQNVEQSEESEVEKLSIARSEECAEDTEFILERKAEARHNKGTTLTWRPPRAAVPLPSYCRLQDTTGRPCTQSHQSLTLAMLPTGTLLVSHVNRDKPEAKLRAGLWSLPIPAMGSSSHRETAVSPKTLKKGESHRYGSCYGLK